MSGGFPFVRISSPEKKTPKYVRVLSSQKKCTRASRVSIQGLMNDILTYIYLYVQLFCLYIYTGKIE